MAGDTKQVRAADLVLDCPVTWAVLNDVRGAEVVLVRTDGLEPGQDFSSNLNVVITPGGCADADERQAVFLAAVDELGKELTDPLLVELTDCEVAGYGAKRVVATYRHGPRALTLEQWLIPRAEDQVTISGTARNGEYASNATTFERIVASIREAS